ncbi:MAG TPA: hypothetical protein P5186_16220 [Candidatus Paceibacterota bacterium]|nr:hypothetical protein [Verrucomicrobiota bacterium]HRY49595.1 hypothetical protein [Candidatus Paceibacterota bacterium]
MERLPGESTQAYEAFRTYAGLGPGRSTREVCKRLNKSIALIGKWSAKHHWVERAAAFDDRLDRITQEAEEAKLIEKAGEWAERMQHTREEAYQMASRLVEKAEAMLKFPLAETISKDGKTIIKPGRWTFADAAKMLDVAHRLKQLVTGLPTDRHEHSGPEGQPLPVVNSQVLFYLPNNGRDN